MEKNKEQKKLIWMKENFIEECKRMLAFIEIQKLKVREERIAEKSASASSVDSGK